MNVEPPPALEAHPLPGPSWLRSPRAQRIFRSAPVWIPVVLCAHIALFGLLPALWESRRLASEADVLAQRVAAARAQALELERTRRAQSDPLFIEREARALRVERTRGAPLELPRAQGVPDAPLDASAPR